MSLGVKTLSAVSGLALGARASPPPVCPGPAPLSSTGLLGKHVPASCPLRWFLSASPGSLSGLSLSPPFTWRRPDHRPCIPDPFTLYCCFQFHSMGHRSASWVFSSFPPSIHLPWFISELCEGGVFICLPSKHVNCSWDTLVAVDRRGHGPLSCHCVPTRTVRSHGPLAVTTPASRAQSSRSVSWALRDWDK